MHTCSPCYEDVCAIGGRVPCSLNLASRRCLQAPAALPRGMSPRYSLDRRLVEPRAGLDTVEKRKPLARNQTLVPVPYR
jgi:hypothetical protein